MYNVEWIQNDKLVLIRKLYHISADNLSLRIHEAVSDLLIAIIFNEDRRVLDLVINEPLHLKIKAVDESSNYYSAFHVSDLKPCAFALGATAESFACFLTAHIYHAAILECDLGIYSYWPISIFLDNSHSGELDICISLVVNQQQYTALNFGLNWLEDEKGRSVLLTDGGFKADDDFHGLIPSGDVIDALVLPLKYMRVYSALEGKCSICHKVMINRKIAYCEICRVKYCLPAEVNYQRISSFNIPSLRTSISAVSFYSRMGLYVNEHGILVNDVDDVPF